MSIAILPQDFNDEEEDKILESVLRKSRKDV
jgi:hypothetical protein